MVQSQSLVIFGLELSPNIQAVILTTAIAIIGWFIKARPKISFGPINNAFFLHTIKSEQDNSEGNRISIYTNKFFIQNTGLAPSKNLEILMKGDGSQVRVWPTIDYNLKQNREGFWIIEISRILGGELIIIDTLNVNGGELSVDNVRSDEVVGVRSEFYVERRRSKWFYTFIFLLFVLGVFSLVEWLVWIAKRVFGT